MAAPFPAAQEELVGAVLAGDVESARRAIGRGADIALRDDDDWNALDRSAGLGATTMVTSLLDMGADPTSTGRDLRTPYEIALAAGHRDTAEVLRRAEEAADPASAQRHVWRPYCRAYLLWQVRAFPGWDEPDAAGPDDSLSDDTVVFVHDDLRVTRSIWHDTGVLSDGTAAGWAGFCAEHLGFHVPDDFDLLPPTVHRDATPET